MFYNLYLVDCIEMKDGKYVLNDDYMLSGVELGERTIAMLSQFFNLTEEEKICIRWHRGTFDKKCNIQEFIQMINECPALYTLHSVEVYISHILDHKRLG